MKPLNVKVTGIVSGTHGTTVQLQTIPPAKAVKNPKEKSEVVIGIQFTDHEAAKEFSFGKEYTITLK